jgi:hypothetical protein
MQHLESASPNVNALGPISVSSSSEAVVLTAQVCAWTVDCRAMSGKGSHEQKRRRKLPSSAPPLPPAVRPLPDTVLGVEIPSTGRWVRREACFSVLFEVRKVQHVNWRGTAKALLPARVTTLGKSYRFAIGFGRLVHHNCPTRSQNAQSTTPAKCHLELAHLQITWRRAGGSCKLYQEIRESPAGFLVATSHKLPTDAPPDALPTTSPCRRVARSCNKVETWPFNSSRQSVVFPTARPGRGFYGVFSVASETPPPPGSAAVIGANHPRTASDVVRPRRKSVSRPTAIGAAPRLVRPGGCPWHMPALAGLGGFEQSSENRRRAANGEPPPMVGRRFASGFAWKIRK